MNQKKITILTLFVVVASAIGINEFIIRNSAQEQDRQVASFGERFMPEQIKWEHELAQTVANENGKTVLGAKPDGNEKFLFEVLEGKYEASVVDGKLLKIAIMNNQTALNLKTEDLINNYASVFKGAAGFESDNSLGATEAVTLKNSSGKKIGNATILRNDQGRVVAIEIK